VELRNIDLNLLVAFDALVSERNVTRAASRIGVGQSAMSSTLGRLRRLLDDPVLVREGRGLVATPLAESLLEPVQAILADVDRVLSQGRTFDPATDARTFTVLLTNYHLIFTFLQPLLARLSAEAPHVHLHIDASTEPFAGGRIGSLEADLLITPQEPSAESEGFLHQTLYSDRYVVVADSDHPDIDDKISYKQFTTLPYIATLTANHSSRLESELDLLGVPRNIEITTEFGVAPFLLRGTRFITVIHERLAQGLADTMNLKLLRMPVRRLQPTIETMVWSQRTDGDPAHQWLRQQLSDLAVAINAPPPA